MSTATPLASASMSSSVLGSVLALILVLLLIFFLGWALRRIQQGTSSRSGPIRVVANAAIGVKERLVLVEVGRQQLLLGVTSNEISLLQRLDTPVEAEQVSASFRSMLDNHFRMGGVE